MSWLNWETLLFAYVGAFFPLNSVSLTDFISLPWEFVLSSHNLELSGALMEETINCLSRGHRFLRPLRCSITKRGIPAAAPPCRASPPRLSESYVVCKSTSHLVQRGTTSYEQFQYTVRLATSFCCGTRALHHNCESHTFYRALSITSAIQRNFLQPWV